jgi:DNA-directed RNA polymerase specialized sigma24 family protein
MDYPAVPTFGDAARAPTDCSAYRDLEPAYPGAFAGPASKPFSSEGLTTAGGELRPCAATGSPADQEARPLLAAISTGNRAAFRQLYFRYFPQLTKFFSHVVTTSDPHVIEELIEEAMFRIWHESAALATQKSPHVSIMRVAYRCGCECRPAEGQPDKSPPKPSGRYLGRDRNPESTWQSLHKSLAALPVAERAVIHLVYSGHSCQEVADILDMSCESVDALLGSSRVALDQWLASSSGTQWFRE